MSASPKGQKQPFYDLEYIKAIPLQQILDDYGITTKRGMFAARNERTASCKIYPNNTWADFGGAADFRGGTPIELIRALEGTDYRGAIRILGERYHAPVLSGEISGTAAKYLSKTEYEHIGIIGSPAYLNMVKEEYAESLGYQQIQQIRQDYNCSMNELFQKDIHTYEAILRSETLPYMKRFYNQYLEQLSLVKEYQGIKGFELEAKIIEDIAREVYSDYKEAHSAYCRAVADTALDDKNFPAPNFDKDLKNIAFKSIEIGEHPYSQLKAGGELRHLNVPHDLYRDFSQSVRNEAIRVPDYSAHLKGDVVTLSCHAQHENTFKGIFQTLQNAFSRQQATNNQYDARNEVELDS